MRRPKIRSQKFFNGKFKFNYQKLFQDIIKEEGKSMAITNSSQDKVVPKKQTAR